MVTLYTEKENGDLKFMTEVEDTDDPVTGVEAFAEQNPRSKVEEFVVLVGSLEDGGGTLVTVSQVEEVRRGWSANGAVEEEEAPKRRGPGRPKGSGKKRGPGRPKGSGTKGKSKAAAGRVRRGRQATLTNEVLEEALSMHNDDGRTMKDIAAELGVASSGYLAKRIREEFGDDALGEVKRGRPRKETEPEAAPKRGRGRPKGSKNRAKSTGKRGPGRPRGSGRKTTPFRSKSDDE